MKVAQAVEYHTPVSQSKFQKKNTIVSAEFVLYRFADRFQNRELPSILKDEVLDFLTKLTSGTKQTSKRNRFSTLSSFYNFIINTSLPDLQNPCNAPIIKKIFRRPQVIQWKIIDKETVDEIIFRTMNARNRIIIELMARGGMRIGEVLKLTPGDIDDRKLIIQDPKSGREGEIVFIPMKLLDRLKTYVKDSSLLSSQRIFPISYVAAWSMVKKSGQLLNVNLRPHEPRISDLVRGKIDLFTIDMLVNMLARVGIKVEIALKRAT